MPDESIKEPQAKDCASCAQNIKGSGQREGSRACRYARKVALLLEHDVEGDIYAASIPAASIFGQQYARFLGGHGIDVNAVSTELRFDTQAEGVKLNFSAVRPLTEDEFATVLRRRNDPEAIDAVTMTVGALDETPGNPVPVSQAAPVPAPVAPPPKPTPVPRAAAPAPTPAAKPQPKGGFVVSKKAEEPEVVEEPKVRESTKPIAVPDMTAVLNEWADGVDD
jgi:hypothetical protein